MHGCLRDISPHGSPSVGSFLLYFIFIYFIYVPFFWVDACTASYTFVSEVLDQTGRLHSCEIINSDISWSRHFDLIWGELLETERDSSDFERTDWLWSNWGLIWLILVHSLICWIHPTLFRQCFPNRCKSEFRIVRLSSYRVSVNLPLRVLRALLKVVQHGPQQGMCVHLPRNTSNIVNRTSFSRSGYICLALRNTYLFRHRDRMQHQQQTITTAPHGVECGSINDRHSNHPVWVTSPARFSGP